MQIPCPGCGEQLPISYELLGKQIRCGGCQRVVDIPKEVGEDEHAAGATVAAVQLIAVPDQAVSPGPSAPTKNDPAKQPAAAEPAGNTPTMLVDCVCGNRSCVPTSSSGSEVRCPSCHRLMRIPNPPAQRKADFTSGGAFPAAPLPSPKSYPSAAAPVGQPPIVHPFKVQPKRPTKNQNIPIIITAVSCLLGLVVLIITAVVIQSASDDPANTAQTNASVEPAEEENDLLAKRRVAFQEGYSMLLPAGCEPVSREETDSGYIIYRFRSEQGFQLTFAIIPDESVDRYTTPPKEISQTFVKGVRELNLNLDVEAQPKSLMVDRMPAVLFRFYERSFMGRFFFTHWMVAMDDGRKLVLNFTGKYGDGESETPPQHWYDSLLSIRHEDDVQLADAELVFESTPAQSPSQ